MTNIAMEAPSGSWNFGLVMGSVAAVRTKLHARYRRWRQYRTTMAELDQYSAAELTELAIMPADITRVAKDAAGG